MTAAEMKLNPVGLLYGKINWRVPKADGDFLQRGVVQTFRQQDEKDILLNHGSASLHLAAGNIRKAGKHWQKGNKGGRQCSGTQQAILRIAALLAETDDPLRCCCPCTASPWLPHLSPGLSAKPSE